MARPDLEDSTTNRDQWNGTLNWNNSAGDWWDASASAQGSVAWASTFVADTDTGRSITFDVTTLFQAIYDNANHTSAVLLKGAGTGTALISSLADATASNRPKIAYDGGAAQTCTDCVSISTGSFGGSTGSPLDTGSGARILIEFPEPASRPTSATMTLYTGGQFGDDTISVFWLRYPSESAPSLLSLPSAPSGVTASDVTASGASISWTDNSSNESGFKVRYAPSPYSSYTTATHSVAASPYLVTGLTDGTSYKAGVAAFNDAGDSTWVESGVFTTTALSKLRPNADTSTGSWSASSGSVLYSMIDETSADDADYITSTSATTCKIKFETSTDPADNSNHSIRIRARSTSGTLTVKLVQGDPAETTLVSWAPTLTSSFANYQYDLSDAEASVITDYSALYLKLTTS